MTDFEGLKKLIILEHRRAELRRLDSGQAGCGCQDCQSLYREIDLGKYGSRLKHHGELIYIDASPGGAEPADYWTDNDATFVHCGNGWCVTPGGETVCIGPAQAAIAEAEGILKDSQDRMRVLCPSYEKCKAPLCPLDNESLKNGIWYPDEDMCHARGKKPRWVINQRRVARKAKRRERYFTFQLLQNMRRVVNPRGFDPDISIKTTTRSDAPPFKVRGEKNKRIDARKDMGVGKQPLLF